MPTTVHFVLCVAGMSLGQDLCLVNVSVTQNCLVTCDLRPTGLTYTQVSQSNRERAADQVIQVGDIVMGRVTRISTRQASVEIICVGETVLREPYRGIVRKEVGDSKPSHSHSLTA